MLRNIKLVFILSIVSVITLIATTRCQKKQADIDISNITLATPVTADTIQDGPVQIHWEPIVYANSYRLEIASPSFTNSPDFIIDTIVSGPDVFINLADNRYEVRVTAMNNTYSSKTSATKAFWVGAPIVGTGGPVVLTSPAHLSAINENFDGVFTWEALPGADYYVFELHTDFQPWGTTYFYAEDITGTTIDVGNLQIPDGYYCWLVRAISGSSTTNYTKNIIYVDTEDPGSGTPWYPTNNGIVSAGQVNFQWGYPYDPGNYQTPMHTILQISSTADFSGTLVYDLVVQGNSQYVTLSPGTYYWRVQIADEAGNLSPVSEVFYLQVTP